MDLLLPPPNARYGIATMTLSEDGRLVEVGPRLVATYDHHHFEFLPEHEVVEPLCWEVITTFGALDCPATAINLFVQLQLDRFFTTLKADAPRKLKLPRVFPIAEAGLLAREMGAS